MQIIINEEEIMAALNEYCAKQVKIPAGHKIKVDFTVGRGENGTRATIDFVKVDGPSADLNETFTSAKDKQVNDAVEEVDKIVDEAAKEPAPEKPKPEKKTAPKKDPKPKTEPEPKADPENKEEQAPFETEEPAETETPAAAGANVGGDSLFNF